MTKQTLTHEQAIQAFFEIRGDDLIDSSEIEAAVREIGNPSANLPITQTAETVDDFIANGWGRHPRGDFEGVIALKRGKRTFANIADCGDHRLVFIEA